MQKKFLVLDEDYGLQVVESLERIVTGITVRYAEPPSFDVQSHNLLGQGGWFLVFVADNTFAEFTKTTEQMLASALSPDPKARVVVMRTGRGKRPDLDGLSADRFEIVDRGRLIVDASTYLRTPPL